MISICQTVVLLVANHANTVGAKDLPPIFSAIVSVLSITGLDISIALPGSGCLFPRFHTSLMIQTIGFVTIGAGFVAAWARKKAKQVANASSHLKDFVIFAKMFLPSITRTISRALACVEYDAGEDGTKRVLMVDMHVNCDSAAYTSMQIYAVVSRYSPRPRRRPNPNRASTQQP